MRTYSKFLLLGGALAALAVPTTASAAGNVNCRDNSLAGTTIHTNVTVPAGARCDLSWATVADENNVTVERGGQLVTFGKTHFTKNVTVNPGGQVQFVNWPVTIDKNLIITDPAANSGNGFWGSYTDTDQSQDHPDLKLNTVGGNIIYTITPTAAAAYPQYQWPYLYLGGGVKVNGTYTYSVGGLSDVRPMPSL